MFDVNRSILKVAELTEEYVAQLKRQHDEDIRITEDAQRGMDKLFNHVAESFDKAIDMLDVYDKTKKMKLQSVVENHLILNINYAKVILNALIVVNVQQKADYYISI